MTAIQKIDAAFLRERPFRHYDLVMAAFVTILLLSNVLGAGKVATVALPGIGDWPFGAGVLFFPIGYVIGDILTEVYGYVRARRCIWVGTAALLFMSWVVGRGRPASGRQLGGGRRHTSRYSGKCRASSSPRSSRSGEASSSTPPCWRG